MTNVTVEKSDGSTEKSGVTAREDGELKYYGNVTKDS
jgi:hypothetical protein